MLVIRRGKCDQGFTWIPRRRRSSFISSESTIRKIQAEFVPHLISPLDLKRGRADDEYFSSTMADDEFQRDQAGFDGLAQSYVVRDQKVDPRHLNRTNHRI